MGDRVGQNMDGMGELHASEMESLNNSTRSMSGTGVGKVLEVNHR